MVTTPVTVSVGMDEEGPRAQGWPCNGMHTRFRPIVHFLDFGIVWECFACGFIFQRMGHTWKFRKQPHPSIVRLALKAVRESAEFPSYSKLIIEEKMNEIVWEKATAVCVAEEAVAKALTPARASMGSASVVEPPTTRSAWGVQGCVGRSSRCNGPLANQSECSCRGLVR